MSLARSRRSRFVALGVAACVLLSALPAQAAPKAKPKARPAVPSVVLMDANTGEILYSRGAEIRRPIASTTKIMTAILVAEKTKLSSKVKVAAAAARVGESSMELVKGEKLTVKQLLYAMMLKSANDAAAALAIHIGKSQRAFARMMTAKAIELGARRTHFANPHGLTEKRNYSTARDLALMAAYGLKNPIFARVVKTKKVTIPWVKHPYPRIFTNHNKMLWDFPGAIGVKTGYTAPAGNCLVVAAKRGKTKVVAVALGGASAEEVYAESARLLRRGLSGFRSAEVITKDRTYGQLKLPDLGVQDVGLVAQKNVIADLYDGAEGANYVPVVSKDTTLPVSKGQVLGKVNVVRHDTVLASAPLVADRGADLPTFWARLGAAWSQRLRELDAVAEHGTAR